MMNNVEVAPGTPDRLSNNRVAVIGLGLMGGSLAMALKGHCALLMGSDPAQSALSLASELAIFDQLSADPAEILPQSDLVILAAPVCTIIDLIRELANLHPGCAVVLDIGSTKSEITKAMEALPARFDPIGGHPVCGKTIQTLANADPAIYRGAEFVLTPLPRTSERALALAEQLVHRIGSRPLRLPADLHDRWVAATSHLPYLLANALVSITSDDVVGLIGPGFRSTARLAGSSPAMMLDILKTNRANILQVLSLYQNQLTRLAETLQVGSQAELQQVLEHGSTRYAELLGERPLGDPS